MTATMRIETTRVAALDTDGQRVSVERQAILLCRDGRRTEIGHSYHYDHSHVEVARDGMLVVLATGERLRLCPDNLGD